jgi:K+/H+ antiporter YhaU regulatory subunit KhtT
MKPNFFITSMCACIGVLLAVLPSVARGDEPATRPAGARTFLTALIPRLRNGVAQLELTDEQKTKAASVLDDAAQQAQSLSEQSQSLSTQERYQKMGPFLQQLRQNLAQALGADQFRVLAQNFPILRGQGSTRPTTAPAEANSPARRYEALKSALAKMDLTDDQKQQIAQLLGETDQKIEQIRQSAAAGDDVQPQVQQLRQDLRSRLAEILTPDQADQLRNTLDQQGAGGRLTATGSKMPPGVQSDPAPPDTRPALPEPGTIAPDFKAVMLGGNVMQLSKWKGHVVVIEFGSLSCPVFRDRAAQMEKLRDDVGMRAAFLVIYTREAFPIGPENLQSNADNGISIPQATDLTERKAAAERAQQILHITLPMAVDSMTDEIAGAYGGMPNGAVVIGKDGKIISREQWTNPDSLRRAIDHAWGIGSERAGQ